MRKKQNQLKEKELKQNKQILMYLKKGTSITEAIEISKQRAELRAKKIQEKSRLRAQKKAKKALERAEKKAKKAQERAEKKAKKAQEKVVEAPIMEAVEEPAVSVTKRISKIPKRPKSPKPPAVSVIKRIPKTPKLPKSPKSQKTTTTKTTTTVVPKSIQNKRRTLTIGDKTRESKFHHTVSLGKYHTKITVDNYNGDDSPISQFISKMSKKADKIEGNQYFFTHKVTSVFPKDSGTYWTARVMYDGNAERRQYYYEFLKFNPRTKFSEQFDYLSKDDASKLIRKLVIQYHPDKGGNLKDCQDLVYTYQTHLLQLDHMEEYDRKIKSGNIEEANCYFEQVLSLDYEVPSVPKISVQISDLVSDDRTTAESSFECSSPVEIQTQAVSMESNEEDAQSDSSNRCELCNAEVSKHNIARHQTTKKCLENRQVKYIEITCSGCRKLKYTKKCEQTYVIHYDMNGNKTKSHDSCDNKYNPCETKQCTNYYCKKCSLVKGCCQQCENKIEIPQNQMDLQDVEYVVQNPRKMDPSVIDQLVTDKFDRNIIFFALCLNNDKKNQLIYNKNKNSDFINKLVFEARQYLKSEIANEKYLEVLCAYYGVDVSDEQQVKFLLPPLKNDAYWKIVDDLEAY